MSQTEGLTEVQTLRAELAGAKDAARVLGELVREKNDEIRALRAGAAVPPETPRVGTYEPTPSEIRRRAGLEHGSAVALLLAHTPVEFIEYFAAIPWTAYVHGPACLLQRLGYAVEDLGPTPAGRVFVVREAAAE